jgi:hypothetical protein
LFASRTNDCFTLLEAHFLEMFNVYLYHTDQTAIGDLLRLSCLHKWRLGLGFFGCEGANINHLLLPYLNKNA